MEMSFYVDIAVLGMNVIEKFVAFGTKCFTCCELDSRKLNFKVFMASMKFFCLKTSKLLLFKAAFSLEKKTVFKY